VKAETLKKRKEGKESRKRVGGKKSPNTRQAKIEGLGPLGLGTRVVDGHFRWKGVKADNGQLMEKKGEGVSVVLGETF